MSKFKDYLCEPLEFSCDTIVIMAEWNTPESFFDAVNEAIENNEFIREDVFIDKEDFIKNVKEDWVHCHIRWDDDEFGNRPARWLGCKWMKWAQKVLTY